MQNKKKNWQANNAQQSFPHQPQPLRVAPRMGNFQKNRGMKGRRSGER